MAEELQRESPVLDNPEAVVALLKGQNLIKDVETLQVLLLNTRRRLIRVEEITDGTIDTLLVHPRERFSRRPSPRMPPPSCWRTIIPAAIRRRARRTSR